MKRSKTCSSLKVDDLIGDFHEERTSKTYWGMLDPSCNFRVTWDLASLCGLFYDVISIPFTMAFDPPETTGTTFMFYLLFLFWTLDIPLSFRTGFYDNGLIQANPSVVARKYLTSWFLLDFLVVSLDWAKVLFGAGGSAAR